MILCAKSKKRNNVDMRSTTNCGYFIDKFFFFSFCSVQHLYCHSTATWQAGVLLFDGMILVMCLKEKAIMQKANNPAAAAQMPVSRKRTFTMSDACIITVPLHMLRSEIVIDGVCTATQMQIRKAPLNLSR